MVIFALLAAEGNKFGIKGIGTIGNEIKFVNNLQ